ncbi:pollen receptor-like kinase 4 [Tanacetum coccineum]|uniref:Pollen receptor-like kinase 4 n=1 Tax=Tanacetum coccineum TaxID=301880 RepID=A0ABQ4X4S8_9ASTR
MVIYVTDKEAEKIRKSGKDMMLLPLQLTAATVNLLLVCALRVIRDDAFEGMSLLRRVDLKNNKFTGGILGSLPGLSELRYLEMQNNEFEGVIPDFEQKGLRVNFANNTLSGPIPPRLRNQDLSIFAVLNNFFNVQTFLKGLSITTNIRNVQDMRNFTQDKEFLMDLGRQLAHVFALFVEPKIHARHRALPNCQLHSDGQAAIASYGASSNGGDGRGGVDGSKMVVTMCSGGVDGDGRNGCSGVCRMEMMESRADILGIHSRKMNLMRGIDLKKIADKMNGASGAELKVSS